MTDLTNQLDPFAGTHVKKKQNKKKKQGPLMCTILLCVVMDVQIMYPTAARHKWDFTAAIGPNLEMIAISKPDQQRGGKEYIIPAVRFQDITVTEILQEGGGWFINAAIEGIQDWRGEMRWRYSQYSGPQACQQWWCWKLIFFFFPQSRIHK